MSQIYKACNTKEKQNRKRKENRTKIGKVSTLLLRFFSLCMRASMLSSFSRIQLVAIPWTVAHQIPLSMGFSRQKHGSELLCPPPGDLPDPGVKPVSPAL